MSLWTPDGEHPVDRNPAPEPQRESAAAGGPPPGAMPGMEGMPAFEDLSPEEQEQARQMAAEMAEAQQRILSVPASTVIANHAMGLYELAAIHLSTEQPNFADAQFAIDAMAALVEGFPGKLGENEPTLREALGQLRLVFVELQTQMAANDAAASDD